MAERDVRAISDCFRVSVEMIGVHPIYTDYPLMVDDVLCQDEDGTWSKQTGLGIFGFTLSPEQEATLEPIGIAYFEML